jgi:hypothetical protein
MADLLDIAPSTSCEVFKINGTRIIVRGLRVDAVASIVSRFPDMAALLLGGFSAADFVPRLIKQCGGAVGPIIAAGTGHLEDEKYERHASTVLLVEDQLKLVTAIVGLTFPNGFGFFLDMLKKLGEASEEAKPVKVRLRKSPSPLPPSSDAVSRPNLQ